MLTTVDLATASSHQIAANAVNPVWAPDGKRVAFIRPDSTGAALVVADADGANTTIALTVAPGESLQTPAWSPDGRWLVVVHANTPGAASHLELVHPDASGRRELQSVGGYTVANPAWSPDSTTLAFVYHRFGSQPAAGGFIATIRRNGNHFRIYSHQLGTRIYAVPQWRP